MRSRNWESVYNLVIIQKWSPTLHPETQIAKNSWGIWFSSIHLFNGVSTL